MAEARKDALAAFDHFVELYEAKYDKAVGCLKKDCEVWLAIYDPSR
jgi:putative transposase